MLYSTFPLIIHYILVPPVAFVGMQRTSYTVREEENPSVGVIVHMPTTACRVEFPFNLRIYTEDVTAGTVTGFYLLCNTAIITSLYFSGWGGQ